MSKHILEGESTVWVKIDNIQDVRDDQTILYKPNKTGSVREITLFDDFDTEDECKCNKKLGQSNGKYILLLLVLLLSVGIALYVVYNIF